MELDIIRLTSRQLLSRGRLLVLGLVAALPPFLALVYAASDSAATPERFLARLCDNLVLTLVLPVLALVLGGAALGNEVEDGTIVYLLMKPTPRWRIVAAKLVTAAVIVAGLTGLSVLVSTLIAGQGGDTFRVGVAFILGAAGGALAYTTVFLVLGLITSRTLVLGLLYVFIWEGTLSTLFTGLRALSIRQYARGIAGALADLPRNALEVNISAAAGITGVALVTAFCFILATHRLTVMDVDSG